MAAGPYRAVRLADRPPGGWPLVVWADTPVPQPEREALRERLASALPDGEWVDIMEVGRLPPTWLGALAMRGEWLHGEADLPPTPWDDPSD
ncbi:hypothetical protein IIA16_01450 [bacterium]|nr:hypothetical protein [bacterium]